ncbi:MBL fold metallo-hydrolase [Nonomuraea africana]|uniref:Ribonuclease Z n=1 Tax=Nonomuraea africana TaxID=46171 RepID=A0ABR9KJH6_9ACTN|nr:MBL fold metallo-hydrolase [Nonomuraea africana]MBE1561975.1 ribonuclease Z [Nonomuraea africana]
MTTTVTLTGTGVPIPSPGRAGPGVLVRCGGIALQFDAGRATVLRLTEAETGLHQLTALFVTHVHSDHVIGLPDVVMGRWIQDHVWKTGPLDIHVPAGEAADFAQRMLEPYAADIALRMEHVQAVPPEARVSTFTCTPGPSLVWSRDGVTVEAVAVHHEPVPDAVAYRVRTPDGTVVISGDTRVCDEVQELSQEADVLVHEACRTTALQTAVAGTPFEKIFSYHADTVALGGLAKRAGVKHLVLTHLIPAPADEAGEAEFVNDVRSGGYQGRISVGRDLMTLAIG